MNADREKARFDAKRLVTQYLGQQPHFAKALAYPEDGLAEIVAMMGGWPPRPGGVEAAMSLVDDALVDELIAHGTPQDGSSTGGGAGRGPDVVQFNNPAHQERTRPILTGLGWLLPSPYGAGSNAGAGRATRH